MADSWNDVFKKMTPVVNNVVKEASEQINLLLREYLYDLWYEMNVNYEYVRTYELINSISVSELKGLGKNGATATVFFDSSKLNHNRVEGNPWGQHESMDGSPIGYILASWIDQGTSGSPYYNFDGVNYVKATMENLKEIQSGLEHGLKALGYDVVVSIR